MLAVGIFLPALGFTIVGQGALKRRTRSECLHDFLAGVTAGSVGFIVVSKIDASRTTIDGRGTASIVLASLGLLLAWRAKAVVVVVLVLAGAAGWLLLGVA